MEKALMIMNPYSGKRQANPYLADIISLINSYDSRVCVATTSGRGSAISIAREEGGDYDKIICIGGDGTLNEVVNGIMQGGHKTPIGYIPAGTTNDFATSLNIPKNPIDAAKKIMSGRPVQLDVGQFCDRYFSYVASFGAFTRASYSTPQNVKNMLGRAAYFLEGIKDLRSIKPIHMKFESEEKLFDGDYIFGAVSNSTSVAGLLSFDPEMVNMSDGMFEVLLVKFPKTMIDLNECIEAIVTQQYYNYENIVFTTAKTGAFYSTGDVDWTVDGEAVESHDINVVKNIHNAITMLL